MEKGKKSGSGRGYISWNDDMDKALLDTFVEYYNKGDRCQNGWKSHVYTTAIKNVREKCNVDISKDNIMARNKTFDKHYTIINGMLESSGFGWDWNKNKISVDSDAVWEEYVAVSFKNHLFQYLFSIWQNKKTANLLSQYLHSSGNSSICCYSFLHCAVDLVPWCI